MWYPLPVKIRNAILDLLYYDVRSLSHLQFYGGMDPFVEQGAIIVVDPDSELHSCKGFRLFSSEKVGRDRLETNQMRAEQNVRDLMREYDSIDTVALAGCGSSLIGAAAFAKTVAKARNKPVAAIVTGLGLRDLMGEIMSGALLFQPSNLVSGIIDFVLNKSHEFQDRVRSDATKYVEDMSPNVTSLSEKGAKNLRDMDTILRERTEGATKRLENLTQKTEETLKDGILRMGDFLPTNEDKSLTELYLYPRWLERQMEQIEKTEALTETEKAKAFDDFVCSIPACAALLELLRNEKNQIDLLVGHSKGAYAINLVAWGMIEGTTDDAKKDRFKKTVNIATFGCGVRLPEGLRAYQYIGEWDVLGMLNTPGIHLPFLPKSISFPGIEETINVDWQKRTFHTTATSMPFSMPVAEILVHEVLPKLADITKTADVTKTKNAA